MRALLDRMLQVSIAKKLYGGFFVVLSLIIIAVFFSALRFAEIRDLYTKTTLVSEINHYLDQSKIARVKFFYTLEEENANNMMKYVSQITAQQENARQLQWEERDWQHFLRLSEQLTQYQHELKEIALAASAVRAQKNTDPIAGARQDTAQWQRLKAADTQSIKTGFAVTDTLDGIASHLDEKNRQVINRSVAEIIVIGICAVLLGALIAGSVTRLIARSVRANLELAQRIAEGDLSVVEGRVRRDELGMLTQAMIDMTQKLCGLMIDIRDSAHQVATASSSIADGNRNLSSRTDQQAAAMVETAASMEELTATVKNNADNARHAGQLARQASGNANRGGDIIKQVVTTMSDITGSSRKIADITSVINSIAFQTNILALNAAVEAARAGEQGRGFAVVASEVRSLAQRSSQAAREIETLIAESVMRVDEGASLVGKAGSAMHEIVTSIGAVDSIMSDISVASDEQSRGIAQIGDAVTDMDRTIQENAAMVSDSTNAALALEEQVARLASLIAVFRLPGGDIPAPLVSDRRSRFVALPEREQGSWV
ncbi:methyl-accepting chemotaxis protein [Brenneria tiliae]|uniref:methyl-accepting chemotaxis protein n=1 Tax=Brenneria tiliae TaxID=2914984 RepID=UPI002014C97A|nr:methyl-accepting chemotaxis protein [Brenneria tiliae]MCL2897696.1 methyl-accepting chemotaxis protein [Brenneria tiliae]MCL2902293.1 methyl-accepting chemotaxis protein [Brenneria tiliae]